MSSRVKTEWLVAVVAIVLLAHPVFAEPPPAERASESEEFPPLETLVREAQEITDAVLAQHLDPPTRQEMWLAGSRAMLAKVGVAHRAGLSAEISQLTTPEELVLFLKRLWENEVSLKDHRLTPDLKQAFVDGMLLIVPGEARLISHKELTVEQQLQGNRYVGTGIALGYDSEKKYPQIANVIRRGPMERAGGRQGDLILKIDDRDAHGLSVLEMVDLLRGDEGTSVTLVVGPSAGEPRTIIVTRGPVIIETLEGLRKDDDGQWDYRVEPWLPICYVKVRQINGSTVHDLRKLERQFRSEGVEAVILDLGSTLTNDLHHTLLLADALLDGGVIGRVRTGRDVREFRADRECLFRDLPLAVLVDQDTRGGGEWIAAALQDNHAALVVGAPTAGIAHVRTSVLLPGNDGALQLNTAIFERPTGRPLEKAMSSIHDQPRRRPRHGEADQPLGGVIPNLPKLPAPKPELERPNGEVERKTPGVPQRTSSVEDDAGADVRRQRPRAPQSTSLDEEGFLRIAVLELRARLDAGQGRSDR